MWHKTSGWGARAKQERLNQPVPFTRQDTNPINFVSNYIALLPRFDPTPVEGNGGVLAQSRNAHIPRNQKSMG